MAESFLGDCTSACVAAWQDARLSSRGANKNSCRAPANTLFSDISLGWAVTCGVTDGGALLCWGDDSNDQDAPPAGTDYEHVSGGLFWNMCALSTTGVASCWGANTDGQGDMPSDTFVSIGVGWSHTCGITDQDEAVCVGENTDNQLQP